MAIIQNFPLRFATCLLAATLFFTSITYASDCDDRIRQLSIKQFSFKPQITLNEIFNALGTTSPRAINEQFFSWGSYGIVVRNGFIIQQIGIIPAVLQQRNTFAFTVDHLREILGKYPKTTSLIVHSYTWSCPASQSSLNAVFTEKGQLLEFNSNLCAPKKGLYYCVGGMLWQDIESYLDSLSR